MTPSQIDTQRLILRTATPEDVEAIFLGWTSDPVATRYMSWARNVSRAETMAFLDHCEAQWTEESVGPCLVALRDTGELIGGSGLSLAPNPAVAEIGYIFAPKYWGRGYATETVHAVIDWARSLRLERLHATVHPANTASLNVMHKSGFKQDEAAATNVRFPNLKEEEPAAALSFSLDLLDRMPAP